MRKENFYTSRIPARDFNFKNLKNRSSFFFVLVLFLVSTSVCAQKKSIPARVDSVMKLMTLEEKIGQLNQYSGREATGPVTKRQTYMLNDIKAGRVGSMLNVHGVKDTKEIQAAALQSRLKIPLLFAMDVIHGYRTVFPIPLAEAASWDLDAIQLASHIAATEASAAGLHWTFAPMVDISRDPRWGRMMEGAGEDVYLGSAIAKARVLGFQGHSLGERTDEIMACAKHFAAYGAVTAGRDYNTVDMSNHLLWETYLPPFKAAADVGVATFMNSFSTLNGIPATGNRYLQRTILKGKWNYKGFVVSDWGSIKELVPWGYATDLKDAALKAITAGSDMDMESEAYKKHLADLIKGKKVDVKLLDDAVRRILTKKFEMGLFDDPYRYCNESREKQELNNPQHKHIARSMAQKSIVLLKNESKVLPLSLSEKTIAVIGPLVKSKRDLEGAWVPISDTTRVTSLYEALNSEIGNGSKLIYARGCEINDSVADFSAAVDAAQKSDVVVMALGESFKMSGESRSRANIHLPGNQEALFEAVKTTGKPVVVVLMAGRPLIFNEIAKKADAIVYAWWLGAEAGNAIADVLFGDFNPSGKLPVTFPRSEGQLPLTYIQYNTGKPSKGPNDIKYKSAYIDELNTPQYAFGYGLSYTNFSYADLKLSKATISGNENLQLSFTLTNAGERKGEEVVQLYIQDPVASVVRPLKELKGFQKIALNPDESKTIQFTIGTDMLSFYNEDLQWTAEPGEFKLMIGAASDDIRLQTAIRLIK
ncbi:MAG: glycoside hydrolase family 3 N-terminal domain-containing protein [Flavisolibacter sp.]